MSTDKQAFYKELQEKLNLAEKTLEECKLYAEEHGLEFEYPEDMGSMYGRYRSKEAVWEEWKAHGYESQDELYWSQDNNEGWSASTQNC